MVVPMSPPSSPEVFANRREAGRVLADTLASALPNGADVVVLALPRGGVPVAAPVATALNAPLDVLVVRKLGVPGQPELAMGAIAGVAGSVEVVRNERVLTSVGVSDADFEAVLAAETRELEEREARLRSTVPVEVAGRTVVLVDDGLATGSTMRAAVAAVRRRGPERIVVAVPVGAPSTCAWLAEEVDLLVCPRQPTRFRAVGAAYDDFTQTTDDEVRALLAPP